MVVRASENLEAIQNSPTHIMRLRGRGGGTLKGKDLKTTKAIHGGRRSPSLTLISL